MTWRALAIVVIVAALSGAFTMTAVAGSRRSASVVERFRRVTAASDATFAIKHDLEGDRLLRAVSDHPDVLAADAVWAAATDLAWNRRTWVGLIAGETAQWGINIDRPLVLSGRLPRDTEPVEVAITESTARLLGLTTGDTLRVSTFSKAELDAWRPTGGVYPGFNGPRIELRVVGVVRVAFELQATSGSSEFVLVTPAFLQKWKRDIGQNDYTVVARIRSGVSPDSVAADLTADLGQVVRALSADDIYARHVREAANVLRIALLVLAEIGLCAGVMVIAIGVGRVVRLSARRMAPLAALGARRRQRVAALVTPIAIAAIPAAAVAVAGAAWASRWLPIGPARRAEARPGPWADVPVLSVGAVVIVTLMLLSGVLAARGHHSRVPAGATRTSAGPSSRLGPAAAVGWTAAVGSLGRRITTVAAAISVAGLLASMWYAASLDGLADAPDRWGYTWSSSPELGFSTERFDTALSTTLADPDVAGAARLLSDTALVGGRPVSFTTFVVDGGRSPAPSVLDGTLPIVAGEVALGPRTAARLGASVGDTIDVAVGGKTTTRWQVVGIVVPPLVPTTSFGEGAFVRVEDHRNLFGDTPEGVYTALSYRDGVDVTALETRLAADPGWRFEERSRPQPPTAVVNVTTLAGLAPWLAGFFAVLAAALAALGSSRLGGSRRQAIATLRAIGFTTADLRRSALVEASIVGTATVALGVAGGVVLCRVVWRTTVRRIGVVDIQPSPLPFIAVTAMLTIALVLASTLTSNRRAAERARRADGPRE